MGGGKVVVVFVGVYDCFENIFRDFYRNLCFFWILLGNVLFVYVEVDLFISLIV